MLEKLYLSRIKKISCAYFLFLFFVMPVIFSMLFYSQNSTGFFHYINNWTLFLKFLLIGCTFTICKIILGSFLVNKSFSTFEKISILISLPLIDFLALSSFSALKGVDIVLLSDTTSSLDMILFFTFYHIAIYIMLYLNYKTDNLNKEPKLDAVNTFLKHQHINFKNIFWLKKAP